ncbi:hypothetical protein JCM10207_000898 [Rhodosporidiobolus poonsookiae]
MHLHKRSPQKALLLAAAAACSAFCPAALAQNSTDATNSTGTDLWTLTTTDFQRESWQTEPYVSNGYIGQRIPAEGFGYKEFAPNNLTEHDGTQGWPLFTPRQAASLVAGFYAWVPETEGTNFFDSVTEGKGEQPIATLPTWSGLYLTVDNATFSTATPSEEVSNWRQSMSIQDGVVTTEFDWASPAGNVSLAYTVWAHRVNPNLGAIRLTVSGLSANSTVALTDVLDGAGAWRTDFVSSGAVENNTNILHTAVRPSGISNVTAYEVSLTDFAGLSTSPDSGASCLGAVLTTNASTASQCFRVLSVPENGELTATKFVGVASSDAFPGAELETALNAARSANETGWDALVESHKAAWDQVWEDADIEIPGEENEELQLVTRASLFHLVSNVRNGSESTGLGDNSIAPAGLTSDSYGGGVYWDADTWMYPSLLALQPDYAENIIDFRYRQLGAAIETAKAYNLSGALYPWISLRFGNSTGIGPAHDYEYHLNSDIALAAWQYYAATGNDTWLAEKGWPIVKNVADMFASFVVWNETTQLYDTYNETSPDEYSNHQNNSAMINGALAVTLQQATQLAALVNETVPSNWTDIIANITILVSPDAPILLEYDGYNSTTLVKQADVVMLTYPFESPKLTDTQSLANLDWYSLRNAPDGPAMTWGVFSVIASQLSPMGCASYSYFLQAAQPYSRGPYYQLSEQVNDVWIENGGTNPAFTFLTGSGGYLQSLTHGFTGYRYRLDRLYFDPSLPPQLTNYTIKGLKWHGSSFDINVATVNTTITRREGYGTNESVPVEVSSRNAQAGNYTLAPGETLTIPTRSNTEAGTLVANNLAQCARVLSNDTSFNLAANASGIVPGEYALAAVDGANATTWQPLTTAPSSFVVDLSAEKTISGLHMNWGAEPPLAYTVSASNATDALSSVSSPSGNATTLASPSVIAQGNVTLSSILTAEQAVQVAIQPPNVTDVQLAAPVVARYVQLTVEGTWYPESGYGGTVAEFAVIGQ